MESTSVVLLLLHGALTRFVSALPTIRTDSIDAAPPKRHVRKRPVQPNLVYQGYRERALAKQVTAREYSTFVAMPFMETFSYRSRKVFEDVVCKATDVANALLQELRNGADADRGRRFAVPTRADGRRGVATEITDDIVRDILDSHIFVADVTVPNCGVEVELGIALGMKSNDRIIILLDAGAERLHFDMRNLRVIDYRVDEPPGAVRARVGEALIEAARAFEADRKAYVDSIKRSLTSPALSYMNTYGRLWRDQPQVSPCLTPDVIEEVHGQFADPHAPASPFGDDNGFGRHLLDAEFWSVARELLARGLMWNNYVEQGHPSGDMYGLHATELGWVVIEALWPMLERRPGVMPPTVE